MLNGERDIVMRMMNEHRPSQVIVDLDAVKHNIQMMINKMDDNQELYAVVKADGYGHGAYEIAQTALESGARGLCVATVDEAIQLREKGIESPILVLGLTDPRGIAEILHYNIIVTVSQLEFFEVAYQQLQEADELCLLESHQLTFHLALDTGMGRIGLRDEASIMEFVDGVEGIEWIQWQGVFTHFSTIGGGPQSYVDHQWQQWQAWMPLIPEYVKIRHFANSAMGLWGNMMSQTSLVRYGISMYGIDPKDQYPAQDALKPALSFISEIVHVKQVPAGESISYGARYTTETEEWIATIPVGYADGWLRHYAQIPILVDGQACPVLGVINMDQLMIRLPKYYPEGTTVTLIGQDGASENHVSQMAHEINTIGYEILTSIGKRVPRIYLKEDIND